MRGVCSNAIVARIERSEMRGGHLPDVAEPVLGLAGGETRGSIRATVAQGSRLDVAPVGQAGIKDLGKTKLETLMISMARHTVAPLPVP